MGQYDHFTHVWVSCYETNRFSMGGRVVNGPPGVGVSQM